MKKADLRRKKNRHRFFSLIELMIVLVILGLLMALVTPRFIGQSEKAKHRTAEVQIEYLSDAVKEYYLDVGEYPSQLQDLVRDPGDDKWFGPYLEKTKVPKDPWEQDYHYNYPGQHGDFDIYSYGADKSAGGEGVNADIGNWE